jgi:hypothetical protein
MRATPTPALLCSLLATQANSLKVPSRLWAHLLPHSWVQHLLRHGIKIKLERLVKAHLASTLMLKGLYADVCAKTAPPEWTNDSALDTIIQTLQDTEAHLLKVRAAYLDINTHVTRDAPLRHTLATLVASNADAFEITQALRWELMELQADADIQAGRTHTFTSINDAIAFLQ